jgi:hypothetical protein
MSRVSCKTSLYVRRNIANGLLWNQKFLGFLLSIIIQINWKDRAKPINELKQEDRVPDRDSNEKNVCYKTNPVHVLTYLVTLLSNFITLFPCNINESSVNYLECLLA